jgi:phage baseplate assembly protein V
MIEAIERLYALILHMIGRGRVTAAKDDGNVQLLQIRLGPDEIRDNTARLAEYGFTSMPPIGADAVALFIGGNRSSGVIIATGHQASRLKNLQSGEVAIFDNQGQSVYLTRTGIVINGANLPITINNTPKVIVNAATEVDLNTALLKVSGKITAGGDISATGDITATGTITAPNVVGSTNVSFGGKSGILHTHSGVQTGIGNTGAPN